jgi:hypothetical protein
MGSKIIFSIAFGPRQVRITSETVYEGERYSPVVSVSVAFGKDHATLHLAGHGGFGNAACQANAPWQLRCCSTEPSFPIASRAQNS